MEYYLAINGNQQGPFPSEQLVSAGMDAQTLVWRDGMANWQRADSIPELAQLLNNRAAPPPPFPQAGPPPVYAQPSSFAPGQFSPTTGAPTYAQSPFGQTPVPAFAATESKRLAAGICAIFLGCLGVHKFILGMTKPGLVMLLVSLISFMMLSPITGTIGLIEGIIYLTKTDEEFYQTYIVGKRAWF